MALEQQRLIDPVVTITHGSRPALSPQDRHRAQLAAADYAARTEGVGAQGLADLLAALGLLEVTR